MRLKQLLAKETGSSLLELLVGGVIAMVALGAIIQLQITGYRSAKSDETRYVAQSEAALAIEQITQDLRMSRVTTLDPDALTLSRGGSTITYSHRASTQEIVRTEGGVERVVGQQVEQLAFALEPDGRTVRVEVTAHLADGVTHRLVSQASPRLP